MKKKKLLLPAVLTIIWIQIIEMARYFLLEKEILRNYWGDAPVAIETDFTFAIWGIWGLLIAFGLLTVLWLTSEKCGYTYKSALMAGTFSWLTMFVVLWVAMANLQFIPWSALSVALPLSFLELVSGAFLAVLLYKKS